MIRFPCNRIQRRKRPRIANSKETPMIDNQVDIETRDGKTTTFITHP